MNYELAKQLKDAGFPQGRKGQIIETNMGDRDTFVYAPALEELIDALPMRIKYHDKLINDAHFFFTKLVSNPPAQYWAYYEGESGEGVLEDLSFREEPADVVCAKLWLAVNNHGKKD